MSRKQNSPQEYLYLGCYRSHLGNLYYFDSCQENAETIVFLHGFTGSKRDFLTLPEDITCHYHCLIPDLPGHGQTQVFEDAAAFSTQGQVAFIQQWLHSLPQQKFHLFGYSMGGRLALQLAVQNPQQLQSLMLVSTTPGIREAASRQHRANADAQLAQKVLNSDPTDFLTEWLSQPLFQGIAERGSAFIAQEVARRLPIQPFGLALSLKGFGSGVMPCVWQQLADMKIPTLVIAGSKDQKYLALASELVSLIPNATLQVLETSHAPLVEAPNLLWLNIIQFLKNR